MSTLDVTSTNLPQLIKQSGAQRPSVSALVNQAIDGVLGNALTIAKYSGSDLVHDEPVVTLNALRGMVKTAQQGDLSQPEAILMAQALALDAIFGSLALRAATALPSDLERGDRLLKLAFKAQAQSRAALETLITAKNPPVVIARQANISAGHQQVNNGAPTDSAINSSNAAGSRAKNSESAPIEVLEETVHVERMDAGTTPEAVSCDQGMEAMGQVNGPAHTGGQGPKRAQRRPRRPQASNA